MIKTIIYIFVFLFSFTTTVNGTTSVSLKHLGNDKEQITRATIGAGEIVVGGISNPDLVGLNRDATKAQETTKNMTTGTLDSTVTIVCLQKKVGKRLLMNIRS